MAADLKSAQEAKEKQEAHIQETIKKHDEEKAAAHEKA